MRQKASFSFKYSHNYNCKRKNSLCSSETDFFFFSFDKIILSLENRKLFNNTSHVYENSIQSVMPSFANDFHPDLKKLPCCSFYVFHLVNQGSWV